MMYIFLFFFKVASESKEEYENNRNNIGTLKIAGIIIIFTLILCKLLGSTTSKIKMNRAIIPKF